MTRFLLALSLAAATLAPPLAVQAKETVTLGYSGRDVAPVVQHLNASPLLQVQAVAFANDDALYEALRAGKVDLAFLGAVRYVQAHHEFGALPVVADGKASRGVIVVPAPSPLTSAKQLRGKRIAFGYENSTTTYLIPLLLLSKNGLQPEDVKGTFAGHQPQALVDRMLAGEFDACAVSEVTLAANKAKLRVLERSEPFPGPPLVARKGFSAAAAAEIRRRMPSYKPPAGSPNQRFSDGAVAIGDADYNRIRFLCKVVLKKSYL
jgi:phosphate/phosphite/phosphonate ABC transporter binding protein